MCEFYANYVRTDKVDPDDLRHLFLRRFATFSMHSKKSNHPRSRKPISNALAKPVTKSLMSFSAFDSGVNAKRFPALFPCKGVFFLTTKGARPLKQYCLRTAFWPAEWSKLKSKAAFHHLINAVLNPLCETMYCFARVTLNRQSGETIYCFAALHLPTNTTISGGIFIAYFP